MDETTEPQRGLLHEEHEFLGASFAPSQDETRLVPASYAGESPLAHALDGCFLADLTGCTYQLVSGDHATDLIEAAFCGRRLAVGEASFEAALTGDANIASAALVLRTGDHEYAFVDPTPRGPALTAWLSFLAGLEQGGFAPYAGTVVEDATEMLAPLLLVGSGARAILEDYVCAADALPVAGQVRNCVLDRIQTVCVGAPLPEGRSAYLLLVPANSARILWRSFLSFPSMSPLGHEALLALMAKGLPWATRLENPDAVPADAQTLLEWGLMREDGGFVGQRSLGTNEDA